MTVDELIKALQENKNNLTVWEVTTEPVVTHSSGIWRVQETTIRLRGPVHYSTEEIRDLLP